MLKIIEKNSLFFALYIIGFFAVFFNEVNKPILETTLYFSTHRTSFGNTFFSYWTLLGEAYPYFLVALFFYFYQKDKQSTLKIAVTGLIILIVAFLLKEIFESPRPVSILENMGLDTTFNYVEGIEMNKGATSFPSGHTAQAFAAAAMLSEEYGYHYKWVPYLSYGIASTVGVLRMANNKHYLSDVLVAAGIGILSTKVAYWTHQYNWGKSKPSKHSIKL